VIALSVAGVLAIFLLYTSFFGGGLPTLRPSQLAGHTGDATLVGVVLKPVTGDSYRAQGLHFRVRDRSGTRTVPVAWAVLRPRPVVADVTPTP